MKVVLFFGSILILSACAVSPKNTVGAAYDADSYYCRELYQDKYEVEGSFRGTAPSNQDLYERYCEPVGSWQARDLGRYERKMQSEKSLLQTFLEAAFD